ncbi:MAG: CBS domain-containing protein [Isosphaerales bacterium]
MATSLTKVELNDPVSRHLHQDFARIRVSQTVSEALDGLRRHPPQGRILYLYVVDDQGRLEGVVPMRRLLLGSPEHPVAEIMVRQVIALVGAFRRRFPWLGCNIAAGILAAFLCSAYKDELDHNADFRIMPTGTLMTWFFGRIPGLLGSPRAKPTRNNPDVPSFGGHSITQKGEGL